MPGISTLYPTAWGRCLRRRQRGHPPNPQTRDQRHPRTGQAPNHPASDTTRSKRPEAPVPPPPLPPAWLSGRTQSETGPDSRLVPRGAVIAIPIPCDGWCQCDGEMPRRGQRGRSKTLVARWRVTPELTLPLWLRPDRPDPSPPATGERKPLVLAWPYSAEPFSPGDGGEEGLEAVSPPGFGLLVADGHGRWPGDREGLGADAALRSQHFDAQRPPGLFGEGIEGDADF